jgi:hypothetical protein
MSHLSVPSRAGNTRQSREGGRLGSEVTYIGFDRPERVERPSLKEAGLVVYGAMSCGALPFHIVAGGHLPDFRKGRQVLDVSRVDNHDHILK